MPTAMTFTSLQEDLRRYLERGNVTDTTVYQQLPRLINNAERDIAQDLKILGFIDPLLSGLVAGTSVYAKPDRWRATVSMNFGTGADQNTRVPIYPRSYEYCRRYWPNSNVRDVPKFYCDYQYNYWLIVPTPVASYPWEILTWRLPALLDTITQSNWLTDYAPTTLLNKSLENCWRFLKDTARGDEWNAEYQKTSATLNGQDLQRIIDRSTAREKA